LDDPTAIAQSKIERSYRPRIAVLPFVFEGERNLSWLASGLAEELSVGLSRIGRLHSVSRHSCFALTADQLADARKLLDVDHLLTGRARVSDGIIKLEIDAPAAPIVLSSRLDDLQAHRDRMIDLVLDQIGFDGPTGDSHRNDHENPAAYLPLLEATQALWQMDRNGSDRASALIECALRADVGCAPAWGLKAFVETRAYRRGWRADRDHVCASVQEAYESALKYADRDPIVLWTTAFADAMLFRRYPQAADRIEQAHAADPCASHILTWGSLFLTYDQAFDMALAYAHRSIAVSPRDIMSVTQGFAGALAAVHSGRHEEAIGFADRVLADNPDMPNVLRIKAVACQHLGRTDEARGLVKEVLRLDPGETIALAAKVNPLREWSGFSRFLDALRLAGLPDG